MLPAMGGLSSIVLNDRTAIHLHPGPRVRTRSPVAAPQERAAPSREDVIACLSSNRFENEHLLREARDAANESNGQLYAVYLSRRWLGVGGGRFCPAVGRVGLEILLNAKVANLQCRDIVGAVLDFARRTKASRIFVYRSRPSFIDRFRRSLYSDLLYRADGLRVDVVGF